jgi:hypothetical protein
MIADRMIPLQAWTASAVSRPLALIRSDSGFGIGDAGAPAGVHLPYVVGHGCGCFLLGSGIGLGLLLGQLTRMHDDKAQGLLSDVPIPVFDSTWRSTLWPC